MAQFFDTADWSWLQFAIDRDASNALVLSRVADRMEKGTTNGLMHTESCGCHSLQLAKNKDVSSKRHAAAAS